MKMFWKRIGYFIGGVFLLNIFISLLDNLLENSSGNMEKTVEVQKEKNKNSEYLKVLGNLKWTDNVATWQKRVPTCPVKFTNSNFEFPDKWHNYIEPRNLNDIYIEPRPSNSAELFYAPSTSKYKELEELKDEVRAYNDELINNRIKFFKENCSIKIGGINFEIKDLGIYEFRTNSNFNPGYRKTHFLEKIRLHIESEEESQFLYDILEDKYEPCPNYSPPSHCFYSNYTIHLFDMEGGYQSILTLKPTEKVKKILYRKLDEIYRSELGSNRLNPDEF